MKATVSAPAKINLTLNIEGRRDDGYHLLSSVFQAVSLADEVTLEVDNGVNGIVLAVSDTSVPCDERNTAYKAAQVFYDALGVLPSVRIFVQKIIPQQAGLGGGSADAAAVLVGLNSLYNAPFTLKQLCNLGEKVGADVPFCIVGGTAFVEGIGEIITPLTPLSSCTVLVVKPPIGVSTKEAYAAVDNKETVLADQAMMLKAIEEKNITAVGALLSNAFQQALAIPEVEDLLMGLRKSDTLGAMMSGSGSAVYALFDSIDAAKAARHNLPADVPNYLCGFIDHGAVVTSLQK